jgi:hypothetical protein
MRLTTQSSCAWRFSLSIRADCARVLGPMGEFAKEARCLCLLIVRKAMMEVPQQRRSRMDPVGKSAITLSIIAIVVSLLSAGFSGLQWNEARLARHDQEAALKEQREELKKTALLLQAQTMEAERANILAQRQQHPEKAKRESDMPRLRSSVVQEWLFPRQAAGVEVAAFLNDSRKLIRLTNEGESKAYDIIATNQGTFSDRDGDIGAGNIPETETPTMLAPSATLGVPLRGYKAPTKEESDTFVKGEIDYYLFGRVQYRDPFQRLKTGSWCYEFHVSGVMQKDLSYKACRTIDVGGLPALNRIEAPQ